MSSRYLITGSENKIAIVDTGPALLLVLLKRDTNMGLVNVEIKDATQEWSQRPRSKAHG